MTPTELGAWFEAHPHPGAILVSLLCLGLGFALRLGTSERRGGARRTAAVVLQILGWSAVATVVSLWMVKHGLWGHLLALIPGVLVARHASYLRLIRRRGMAPDFGTEAAELETAGFQKKKFMGIFSRARAAHDREFRVDVLAVRYGIPALIIALVGFAEFEVLVRDPPTYLDAKAQLGAKFAAAGAYTYVLLYLGQRSLRRDLTSGAAVWSAVTMTLGPLLGGVLALLWAPATASDSSWSFNAIFFVAGLAPRYAASAVEEVVRRLWLTRTAATPPSVEAVALTQIHGITPEIEDRLSEEGITDAYALAMAEPMKLYRNTAFDQRQILSWIDEALLVVFFPDDWDDVRKADVSGVIDLATRFSRVRHSDPQEGDEFDVLAKRIAKPSLSAALLRDIASLLYDDAQVELVWALYQVNDATGEDDDGDGPDPALRRLSMASVPETQVPAGVVPWVVLAVAGVLAAALFWNTSWPLSSTYTQLVGACAVLGAGVLVAMAATPLVEPHAPLSWRAGVLGMAVVLGSTAWVWGSSVHPTTEISWSVGTVLLAMAAATFGGSMAWAVVSAVTRTTIAVEFIPASPEAPTILIDGDKVVTEEKKKIAKALRRGAHDLLVQCKEFRDIAQRFDTRLLRWNVLQLRLLPTAPSGIVVTVRPSSPEKLAIGIASLDGKDKKQACPEDEFIALTPGTWLVTVEADAYKKRTHTVDIRVGERLELKVKLKRRRAPVSVSVPKGASIVAFYVDGVRQPIASGQEQASTGAKTGERKIAVWWTEAPPVAPAPGQTPIPPPLHKDPTLVLVPKDGITLKFPTESVAGPQAGAA